MRAEVSLYSDTDCVTWSAEVRQAHWNLGPGRDTARHTHVHLVQLRESGSLAKIQDLGQAAADRHLRRNETAILQACAVDFQQLSRNAGIAGRNDSGGPCVENRTLPLPVSRNREQLRGGH